MKEFFVLMDKNWNHGKIKELAERWLSPANNLNLAPSDYYLYSYIAQFLHSWHFTNQEEVEASVKEFFALKDKNWYQCGIKELAERWFQTVQHFECAWLLLL